MEFLHKLEKIEKVVTTHKNRLEKHAHSLLLRYSLESVEKEKAVLQEIANANRLMHIGIVGRVKAGKSSLLNAIAFNGKNVLPRASTPMTAALTEITYGDKFAVEVDFFSPKDIDNIKKEAQAYDEELQKLTQEKFETRKAAQEKKSLKERVKEWAGKKQKPQKSDSELREEAEKSAQRELADTLMAACKDQYERMQKSNITLSSLKGKGKAQFKTLESLQSSLEEYVGSSGKYMPFTRSVKIYFQTESFKDVSIIDTPGVNDPVVSREQRTREELGKCDVVFIVSPAGQFMSKEDLDLMDRITDKNGIKELYAVASKVDTQLMGSEKDKANGDFKRALENIRSTLTDEMKKRIDNLKKENPEIDETYDSLLRGNDAVLCTSGIATSIKENLDDISKLDEIEAHTFKLLQDHYPKEFNGDVATTKANLDELAKIAELKNILDEVKKRKDSIIKQKIQDASKQKMKTIDSYLRDLIEYVANEKNERENTNIKELEGQQKQIQKIKENGSMATSTYNNNITLLQKELQGNLLNKLNARYREIEGEVEDAEDIETRTGSRTIHVEQSGFGGGVKRFFGGIFGKKWGYDEKEEQYSYQVNTIRTGAVKSALQKLVDDIEQEIRNSSIQSIQNFKERLPKEIIPALRSSIIDNGGDETTINVSRLCYILQNIINSVHLPNLSYTHHEMPYSNGVLEGSAAESFMNESMRFIHTLKDEVKRDILNYTNAIIKELKAVKLADEFFSEYDKQLEQLKNDMQHQAETLAEFSAIEQALKAI